MEVKSQRLLCWIGRHSIDDCNAQETSCHTGYEKTSRLSPVSVEMERYLTASGFEDFQPEVSGSILTFSPRKQAA
jgi:S-adenosylmethionine synthetase